MLYLGVGEVRVFTEASAEPEVADLYLGFGGDKNVRGLHGKQRCAWWWDARAKKRGTAVVHGSAFTHSLTHSLTHSPLPKTNAVWTTMCDCNRKQPTVKRRSPQHAQQRDPPSSLCAWPVAHACSKSLQTGRQREREKREREREKSFWGLPSKMKAVLQGSYLAQNVK